MKYAFNPRNRQINPVTESTFVDPTLRDKEVSSQLYAIVCTGKVSIDDVAAMFAVGKSPEVLVKRHTAVKESPQVQAPAAPVAVPASALPSNSPAEGTGGEGEAATADGAFDGRELCAKKLPELLIIAGTVGIDVNAPDFEPTRPNLIKAIRAKAEQAEAGKPPVESAAVPPAVVPPVVTAAN